MASGMSAAMVSRIGLPLSQDSARATFSRFASIRSAIRLSTLARSFAAILPQPGAARCAASRASSMSSPVLRATSQKTLPVTGVTFSKYWPLTGGTRSPPIQLSYRVG
jgi:hypothetical protein